MQVSSVPNVDVSTRRFAANVPGQDAHRSRNRVDGKHARQVRHRSEER
jgi:hypothetical protein